MNTKWLIIGGIVVFLYLAKKKKDREKEEKKVEEAIKANQLSDNEKVGLIRLKIEEWLNTNVPELDDDEVRINVIQMTTGLSEYKEYLEQYEKS